MNEIIIVNINTVVFGLLVIVIVMVLTVASMINDNIKDAVEKLFGIMGIFLAIVTVPIWGPFWVFGWMMNR